MTRKFRSLAVACGLWPVASLLALTPAAAQGSQSDRDFRWDGAISSGRWAYVRNLNGSVRVERASGGRLEVTAVKRWRRGDPEDVRVEVTRVGSGEGDILVCALWRDITEDCDERGYRTQNNRRRDRWSRDNDDDVSLEITVRVPEGVKVDLSSINGGLDITGATAEVEAHTVNGGIDARSSGGPVNASTVNGNIDVRMGAIGSGNLDFSTTNGSITVTVPDGLNADITMRTVNGSVGSDFPMTVNGRISPRRIAATIGRGGMKIDLSTVNGSIDLRRG
jgi:Putative adhesin